MNYQEIPTEPIFKQPRQTKEYKIIYTWKGNRESVIYSPKGANGRVETFFKLFCADNHMKGASIVEVREINGIAPGENPGAPEEVCMSDLFGRL